MRQPPCDKYCPKRSVTCHSECKEYKEWRAEKTEDNKRIYKQQEFTRYLNGTKIKNIQEWYTKKRRNQKKF